MQTGTIERRATMVAGNSCWIRARNCKRSRECSRMRASSVGSLSFLFSFFSLSLSLECISAFVFWNAATAAATRRKRFDSIAVAAERLDGKVLAGRRRKDSTLESRALGGSEEEGESVKGSERKGARKGERGKGCMW